MLRCPLPVTVGAARHVLYCCHRGYKDGVFIILLELISLHYVILLNALPCSYEINTLDAGMSRSMSGVIVVDSESFRST